MEYIHIKKLKDYHPGYKDRNLLWCKIYFTMVSGDPDFEMIESEIDKWRFVNLIILELQAKKPIPLDGSYLIKKGWDIKKRPISLTIQMLHNFIEVVTEDDHQACIEVDKEVDKDKDSVTVTDFFNYYTLKTKRNFKLTPHNKNLICQRLSDGFTIEQLKLAVDNFTQDKWDGRKNHMDLVYCIGIRNKIDNLQKWINYKIQEQPQRRTL